MTWTWAAFLDSFLGEKCKYGTRGHDVMNINCPGCRADMLASFTKSTAMRRRNERRLRVLELAAALKLILPEALLEYEKRKTDGN